jgi:VCBS repeat-containing protein
MALIFSNNFDTTVTTNASSQAYQDTVAAVENFLSAQLTTLAGDVTLQINWRYDTQDANGKAFAPTTLANNIFGNTLVEVSYADLRNALLARVDSNDSNPGDDAAFTGALPVTDPAVANPGTDTVHWWVSRGQEKLLGLNGVAGDAGNAATDPDTSVTMNSVFPFDFDRSDGITAGQTDAFGVMAHELTEVVMGRFMFGGVPFNDSKGNPTATNNYSLMDLLHFQSAANGGPARSIFENNANNIISFTGTQGDPNFNLVLDNNGDIADPNSGASPRDAFADSASGVINAITQTELRIMDAIGWTRVHNLDDHSQDAGTSAVLNDDVNGLNGNLELQADHDWFKVNLVNTKHYIIKLEGSPTGNGTLADPFLALYGGADPSRDTTVSGGGVGGTPSSLIMTDNDSGVGSNGQLSIGLNNGGTFFVDAGSFGAGVQNIGTGTYHLTLIGNTPVVLSADAGSPHAITELSGTTNSSTARQVSGTLSFADADVGDTHTAAASISSAIWSVGGAVPLATQAALATAMLTSISVDATAGSLAWQFSLADKNVDFLAVGETLTAVYNITVTDHRAGSPLSDSSTQQVTVTFTGTNDTPMLDATSVLANTTSERANLTNSTLTDTSTPFSFVAFTDPDLSDRPTATLKIAGEAVTWQDATHNYTSELTPAQIGILEAALSISPEVNTNTGKIDWQYNIVDKNIDFLGGGESLTVTAPVVIDDGNGGVLTQNVVATINGANDNPIAAADSNGTIKKSVLTVSASKGLLSNDTDPDIHDNGNLVVGAVGGVAANVGHSVAGTYGSVQINANGSYVYTANQGSLPSKIVAQDTFTYTVADGHGGTDISTLSVIVSNPGTNYLAGANTTLLGGNGSNVLDGSGGHDILIGGNNAADVLVGGIADTMTGGSGPDTFLFRPHFGANTITDFDVLSDTMQLDKSIFFSVADLLSHTTNTANGAVIDDTHGDTITLTHVTLQQLQTHPGDFYFV